MTDNDGQRFARLPSTEEEREDPKRATRREVVDWWVDRFDVPDDTFEGYSFWEKGAGKIWIARGEVADGLRIEALGMRVMHTRQEHWKPTTDAVQRFGPEATRNVVDLDDGEASRFVAGESQEVEWDGDWGYLIATREVAGEREPLGVGLFTYGELKSQVPKGRRRELD